MTHTFSGVFQYGWVGGGGGGGGSIQTKYTDLMTHTFSCVFQYGDPQCIVEHNLGDDGGQHGGSLGSRAGRNRSNSWTDKGDGSWH